MRTISNLTFFFLCSLVLSIPVFLLASNHVFAADVEAGKWPVIGTMKEEVSEKKQFKDDWNSPEWKHEIGDQVRLKFRYDITDRDDTQKDKKLNVVLQQKKKNDFEEVQRAVRYALDQKDQEDVIFTNLKKGETYRIVFDGVPLYLTGNYHRINYTLYYDAPKLDGYELKAEYKFNRDKDDELKFSIVNKDDQKVHFNGKVNYQITPDVGKKVSPGIRTVTSKSSKSFRIKELTDQHLPAETEMSDRNIPVTKVIVNYFGTVDTIDGNSKEYLLSKEFNIQRFKDELELEKKKGNGEITIIAKTKLGDDVKDRKWEFELKDKDGDRLEVKNPKGEGTKAQATFTLPEFKNEKSGSVTVTFTGRKSSVRLEGINLYRETKKINVDAPAEKKNNDSGPKNDGPKNDGPKEDEKKDQEKKDDDKTNNDKKDQKDKKQDDQQNQDQQDRDQRNRDQQDRDQQDKDQQDQNQQNNQREDNEPKNDDPNNRDPQREENPKNEEPKDEDKPKNDRNNEEVNQEAAIELSANVLKEQKKVEIVATLKNVDQPEGKWKLVFNAGEQDEQGKKDEQVIEEDANKSNSLKKEFSIEKIEKETVKVIATFKGKDKKGKIDVTQEEEIKLKEDSKGDDDSGKKDDSDDQGGTTSDEETVKDEVITKTQSPNSQIGGRLPKTATHYGSNLFIGILFLISGGIIFSFRRRVN